MKRTIHGARGAAVLVISASVLVMACATAFASSAASSSGVHITILADTTRVPAIQAFEKANPKIKVTIQTFANTGNNGLEQKFALYNKAGRGWPDVFFSGGQDLAWAANSKINYTADISSTVSARIQKAFGPSVLAVCKQGSRLLCLNNDLGQVVLWYNATLFKQWGYTAPTTWEQYETLSLKIAKEHPGYFTGFAGDVNAPSRYLWPSGCPTSKLLAPMTVRINLKVKSCTRVQSMLAALLDAKVVSPIGLFDADAPTQVGPKLVMTPGASWYGDFIFQADLKVPAGQMSAGLPLHWAGEKPGTGAEGGGLWMVSRHAKGQNLAAAVKAAIFLTTNKLLLTNGVTFPAYGPAQQPWLEKQGASNYFNNWTQVAKSLKVAAQQIRTDTNYVEYIPGDIWSQTVTAALAKGASFGNGWNDFATQLVQQAKSFGYTVKK